MARRSGFALIEMRHGVLSSCNGSALTALRMTAHQCTRFESLPSPRRMIENWALDSFDFGCTKKNFSYL
jgi:hypothetical protein